MSTTDVTTDLTDPELISLVRGGDVDAYGILFARHVDAANRLASMLVSGPDADDLVSEAFVKVLNVLLAGGGPDVAFRAYLLTAVRRLNVDKVRSTQRATPTDDLTPYDRGVPFTDTAIAGFEGGAAAKAFASLPERWQLVLWHLEVENQKPADIAPLLGMSANSVSALAYRAREGLRQAFLNMHSGNLTNDDCRQTHELLGGYVRRGLARRDTSRVEAHLEHCRHCAATYLELEEVNSSLSALLGPAVLGGAAAAYLGTGGIAALGGGGGWASLIQMIDRSKDAVLASPTASMATASMVSVTTATAVVVGVHATPLTLPSFHPPSAVAAAAADRNLPSRAATAGFAALDRMREEIAQGLPLPALVVVPLASPTADATPQAAVLPETPVEVIVPEVPVDTPVPDPGPVVDVPVDPPVDVPVVDPPVDVPVDQPTDQPTDNPTPTPTDDPTPTPTDDPTPTPTDDPTPTPTDDPTATATPTDDPTPTATATPTDDPTPTATATPTDDPTPTPPPGDDPTPTPPPGDAISGDGSQPADDPDTTPVAAASTPAKVEKATPPRPRVVAPTSAPGGDSGSADPTPSDGTATG